MRKILFFFLFIYSTVFAQEQFSVSVIEQLGTKFPRVHSFAHGKVNNKHVFIGGRINGLHGFTSAFGFPLDAVNDSIFILNSNFTQKWSVSTSSLSNDIREAITSSNMEYYQDGNTLYMIGGYGWRSDTSVFVTFKTLTAINLTMLESAVTSGTGLAACFRQITDSRLKVCGTHLKKIGTKYILPMGHDFDGTYSRNDTAGFYKQKYTNQIRSFEIIDDGINLAISNYAAVTDTINLHRRDYNLVPQVENNSIVLSAFSGVFQYGLPKPYTNIVNMNSNSFNVVPTFNQQLSHYHSAVMPIYDSLNNTMHTIFFGGEAMYYYSSPIQQVVYDSAVPFVSTISKITKDASGNYTEYLMPDSLPGLMGSNALFIPIVNTMYLNNEIVNLNSQPNGNTLVGYIVGGINSPERNINSTDPSVSEASNKVLGVYVNKLSSNIVSPNMKINQPFNFSIIENPIHQSIKLMANITTDLKINMQVFDMSGKVVFEKEQITSKNKEITEFALPNIKSGIYTIKLFSRNYTQFLRFIK